MIPSPVIIESPKYYALLDTIFNDLVWACGYTRNIISESGLHTLFFHWSPIICAFRNNPRAITYRHCRQEECIWRNKIDYNGMITFHRN